MAATNNNITNNINNSSYQQISTRTSLAEGNNIGGGRNDSDSEESLPPPHEQQHAKKKQQNIIVHNFIRMSLLFSANHACTVSCLSLATAQFGAAVGAWQSGILYIFYTASGLFGATYVVKTLGDRNALICGMALYCIYVATFWMASTIQGDHDDDDDDDDDEHHRRQRLIAYIGAAIGGIGGGFLWAAQGSFFTRAAQLHAAACGSGGEHGDGDGVGIMMVGQQQPSSSSSSSTVTSRLEVSTNRLAAIFAFIYLIAEVTLRGLSSLLLSVWAVHWSAVFAIYALVAVLSTVGMFVLVEKLSDNDSDNDNDDENVQMQQHRHHQEQEQPQSWWYRSTAAVQLLRSDAKMKYMIGLNAVFGLSSAFLNSYINGQVVRVVLHDDLFKKVGYLTSFSAAVAAVSSIVFAKLTVPITGKGPVLMLGATCFALVALPFLLVPDLSQWTVHPVATLIVIYALYGMGRATFESTLKAVFADLFYYEKEGAFANIILQNGLSSAIGYVLTFSLLCNPNDSVSDNGNSLQHQIQHDSSFKSHITSAWCVEYHDGTFHNVGAFELLVLLTSLLAILGYLRANHLHHYQQQHEAMHQYEDLLLQEDGEEDANDPTLETTTTTTTATSNSISASTIHRK
jgi:hypothetical protein